MTATVEQAIRAEAIKDGHDPDEAVAAAKRVEARLAADGQGDNSGDTSSPSDPPVHEQAKLFQYHLPFVTVKEVRENWLGLDAPFVGDSEVAAVWAAAHGGGTSSGGTGNPPPQ